MAKLRPYMGTCQIRAGARRWCERLQTDCEWVLAPLGTGMEIASSKAERGGSHGLDKTDSAANQHGANESAPIRGNVPLFGPGCLSLDVGSLKGL